MKSITILTFSSRKNGNSAGVRAVISKHYQHMNVRSFCLHDLPPCGNCNYSCLRPENLCPKRTEAYVRMMDTITESDLVYFVIPNFCGFPCSEYFVYNERSVGYFNQDQAKLDRYLAVKKRFIIISNSESIEFRSAMQQQTEETPDIFYLKSNKYANRSIDGNLMNSVNAAADLQRYLDKYPL